MTYPLNLLQSPENNKNPNSMHAKKTINNNYIIAECCCIRTLPKNSSIDLQNSKKHTHFSFLNFLWTNDLMFDAAFCITSAYMVSVRYFLNWELSIATLNLGLSYNCTKFCKLLIINTKIKKHTSV